MGAVTAGLASVRRATRGRAAMCLIRVLALTVDMVSVLGGAALANKDTQEVGARFSRVHVAPEVACVAMTMAITASKAFA